MKKPVMLIVPFLMAVFLTSCGQSQTNSPKETIVTETKDTVTSPGSNEKYHTKYEYTDSTGKSLIIQNSFPKGEKYTDPNGKEYFKSIFWTRVINETGNPFELTIDFSGDSYELPSSVGSSVNNYRKIILPPDTMTHGKQDGFNYGLKDLDSFLGNSIDKPSSLKRTINPKESSGFYVVMLLIKPKSGGAGVKGDGNAHTRAGFSLKGKNLFYTVNGKEIHCGKINLKNLILKK
jgi:hypothetical protein